MARILIFEDEVLVQQSLSMFLEMSGHSVTLADDGSEAAALCRQVRPHIVITDLVMPRVEGIQTIRDLRAAGYPGPIIAMSGGRPIRVSADSQAGADYLSAALAIGASATLEKPFRPQSLLQLVRDCLAAAPEMLPHTA